MQADNVNDHNNARFNGITLSPKVGLLIPFGVRTLAGTNLTARQNMIVRRTVNSTLVHSSAMRVPLPHDPHRHWRSRQSYLINLPADSVLNFRNAPTEDMPVNLFVDRQHGQTRTNFAIQALTSPARRERECEAVHVGALEIDKQLVVDLLSNRQVGRLGARNL